MATQQSLTALKKEDLVTLLKNAGSRFASLEALEADIAEGAPVNPDGTINFVTYSAWLILRTKGGKNGVN